MALYNYSGLVAPRLSFWRRENDKMSSSDQWRIYAQAK